MPIAGYRAAIKRSGTSAIMAAETMTILSAASGGASVTFFITTQARRCIDPAQPWSVLASGVTQSFSSVSIDFLAGRVIFAAPVASSTSVAFNGNYLPLTTASEVLSECTSFSLTRSTDLQDSTVFSSTATCRRRTATLRDMSASVDMYVNETELNSLRTSMNAGSTLVLEIYDGTHTRFRGYVVIDDITTTGQVDGLLEASVNFPLSTYRDTQNNRIFTAYTENTLM